MSMNTHRLQRGLSLVEVFVALLILSVGLIALAKLQVDLVRGGADSRARAAGLAVAEAKIEDLRTFSLKQAGAGVTWPVSTGQPVAWSLIADNAGGRIPSGALPQAGVQYNLSWTSTVQATDGPVAGGSNQSLYKVVGVNVSWTGPDDIAQTVTATASITDTPPSLAILASSPIVAGEGPALLHEPGAQPEVIAVPIDVGDTTRRETSKPLPTIKKTADSTMVTFDVVNYTTGTEIVQRREEFATITCRCTFAGTGAARTPAKVVVSGNLLRDQPGNIVTKTIGVPADSLQPPLCNICCRDHHDYTDGTDNYRYNPENGSNHAHYIKAVSPSPAVTSGDYDEACRLKRVNGIFQVFEDWHLRTLTVLPKTDLDLNAPKVPEYVQAVKDYVIDFADAKANGGTVPSALTFTPSAVALDPNAKQLLARAIYIDNMPSDLLAKIDAILSDGDTSNDASVLSLVPFYELHLTKLADWISRDTDKNKAKVTSNAIPDQNNVVDDGTLDGTGSVYSRGLAQPQSGATTGDTLIVASARNYNTGITNTLPINTTEDEGHPISETVTAGPYYYSATPLEVPPAEHKDGSITVSVGGGISISGSFQKATGSPRNPVAGKIGDPTGTNGAVCQPNGAAAGIESYSCTVPTNWTGSITFLTSSDYEFCLSDDGSAGTPCTALSSGVWAISTPVTASIGQDIFVWDPE